MPNAWLQLVNQLVWYYSVKSSYELSCQIWTNRQEQCNGGVSRSIIKVRQACSLYKFLVTKIGAWRLKKAYKQMLSTNITYKTLSINQSIFTRDGSAIVSITTEVIHTFTLVLIEFRVEHTLSIGTANVRLVTAKLWKTQNQRKKRR
jgi:hypothetical protein